MSYRLVIAEKPSVAQAYAKVLGATNRNDGYLEGNGYLVSWCIGHLVELAPPNVYDAKYVKWSIADLPILPQKWQYLVSSSTKKTVWHPAKADAPPGCGQYHLCNGRRTRGRADFPACLPASRVQKAIFTTLAFQHGGQCNPGGLCNSETVN